MPRAAGAAGHASATATATALIASDSAPARSSGSGSRIRATGAAKGEVTRTAGATVGERRARQRHHQCCHCHRHQRGDTSPDTSAEDQGPPAWRGSRWDRAAGPTESAMFPHQKDLSASYGSRLRQTISGARPGEQAFMVAS
jgi:hypothetical protein